MLAAAAAVLVVAPGAVVGVVGLPSLAHVFGPLMPSAVRPFCCWNNLSAVAVRGPNWPSTATVMPLATSAFWICSTPGPLSPRCTLSAGSVTVRPPDTVVVVAPGANEELGELVEPGALDEVDPPGTRLVAVLVVVERGTVVALDVGDLLSLLHATRVSATAPLSNRGIRRRDMNEQ